MKNYVIEIRKNKENTEPKSIGIDDCNDKERAFGLYRFLQSLYDFNKDMDINIDEESIIFKNGFKEKYFEANLFSLKKFVNEVNLKSYTTSKCVDELNNILHNNSEFEILNDNNDIVAIGDFFREIECDKKYYLCRTFEKIS